MWNDRIEYYTPEKHELRQGMPVRVVRGGLGLTYFFNVGDSSDVPFSTQIGSCMDLLDAGELTIRKLGDVDLASRGWHKSVESDGTLYTKFTLHGEITMQNEHGKLSIVGDIKRGYYDYYGPVPKNIYEFDMLIESLGIPTRKPTVEDALSELRSISNGGVVDKVYISELLNNI